MKSAHDSDERCLSSDTARIAVALVCLGPNLVIRAFFKPAFVPHTLKVVPCKRFPRSHSAILGPPLLLATPTKLSGGQSYASHAFSSVSTQFTNPSPRSPSKRGMLASCWGRT